MVMSTLTETSTWEPGIYQLERADLWDAGTAGNGIGNLATKQLANRTLYLKNQIAAINSKIKVVINATASPITVTSGNYKYGTGEGHNVPVIVAPDYTTPNDGITRTYKITLSAFVDFTYGASQNIQLVCMDFKNNVIGGPQLRVVANCRQPFMTVCTTVIVALAPATPLKLMLGNNTLANANFSGAQMIIEEF